MWLPLTFIINQPIGNMVTRSGERTQLVQEELQNYCHVVLCLCKSFKLQFTCMSVWTYVLICLSMTWSGRLYLTGRCEVTLTLTSDHEIQRAPLVLKVLHLFTAISQVPPNSVSLGGGTRFLDLWPQPWLTDIHFTMWQIASDGTILIVACDTNQDKALTTLLLSYVYKGI